MSISVRVSAASGDALFAHVCANRLADDHIVIAAEIHDFDNLAFYIGSSAIYNRAAGLRTLSILCLRHLIRIIATSLCVRANSGIIFFAENNAKVTVCEDAQGAITIRRKGRLLQYSTFLKQSRQAEVVSSKSIDHKLKQPTRPADNHPWRSYRQHLNGQSIKKSVAQTGNQG